MDSSDLRLSTTWKAGKRLLFAIERFHDGAFHHPADGGWRRLKGRSVHAPMRETEPGHYEIALPALDAEQDYCLVVIEDVTEQIVVMQFIDGEARQLTAQQVWARKGRPAPRCECCGGFVIDIRAGRQVDLE
jgi:hypothetical protein